MKSTLAALVLYSSLSYTLKTFPFNSLPEPIEMKEQPKEENLQDLANTLYARMKGKDILILFFESYGAEHKGFYVERNRSQEEQYLIFHADDQQQGKTAVIRINAEYKVENITIKKVKDGKAVKEASVSSDDTDALLLYRRMLETSAQYIDQAEITKHPVLGNFAKYNLFIEDQQFVTSMENLFGKNGI